MFALRIFFSGLLALAFPAQGDFAIAAPAACPPIRTFLQTQSGASLKALLSNIGLGTKWSDLSADTKAALQSFADKRLESYRDRWGADALVYKEAVLLSCPTKSMLDAMDDYYRKTYDFILPKTFELNGVSSPELRAILVRHYLGSVAAYRASLTYPNGKVPNRDWDGESLFDSVLLPDLQTHQATRKYNADVVAYMRRVDVASYSALEKSLFQEVLYDARSKAAFGGSNMESACSMISAHSDVVGGYQGDSGRPKIFNDDEAVLREVNAIFLGNIPLKWLDVGTMAAATKMTLCKGTDDDLEKYVGKPADNDIAKAIVLLRSWWLERLSAHPSAQSKCTVYTPSDRETFWQAFSGDLKFNNDNSSSMETYRAQLSTYRDDMIARYRMSARFALAQVFPDDLVLSSEQRKKVHQAIDAETAFGLFPTKISAWLDAAQNAKDGAAASAWKAALQTHVRFLGGDYAEDEAVRPNDEADIRKMFEQVKAWVASRYGAYPTNIPALYAKFDFSVNTSGGASTSTTSGNIKFGVGTRRSRMEYFSILIHELRHAVNFARLAAAPDKSSVTSDLGPVLEGAGVAVENLLLDEFLKDVLKSDIALALYSLDFGIRDARFVATTDATLQKFFRSSCSAEGDANSLEFTKSIAASYGLTGALADTLSLRSHIGTQYFQYIYGGVQVVDDIAFLQSEIDPAAKTIDPFVLFSCGLNNPRRDKDYVAKLKSCLGR